MQRQNHEPATRRLLNIPGVAYGLAKVQPAAFPGIRDFRYQIAVGLILLLILGTFQGSTRAAETREFTYCMGFSSTMFADVNENDARAAVKIWGGQIAMEHNIPTDPVPVIFKGMDALLESLLEKQVDTVGITTIEYDQLKRKVKFHPLFVAVNAGGISERYVLLTHQKGPVRTLADLDGCSLTIHTNPRTCLAPLWLDMLLTQQGHPVTKDFTGRINRESKLAKVVLPVFFGRVDACVLTHGGFDTMAELNPQLARQLVILAESPEMVPTIFAFRANYNPVFKEKLIKGLKDLKKSPAGQQVLTIFQSDELVIEPASSLDTALELIATHKQLARKGQQP
ncbi:ABC-type phosphate/phosphonate transport system, putative periplasmic component [Desulforapulum autotrophicum HRM2]|jgi:phosphonate transport system substrate-binding protein|uniref:ABC-type phosphate/phosphonate transport system, putative periplasmic component n=1 Tax=Desulforapulum autotrophicum (strain ATCC 43914 / DSM 3382 / VKM B-1955 / HRM2) TaxID=177437 RepID=C0QAA0_DESAH|nr:PhnD/SsuA/transferrin family substrate-binding protein [Desulforapulum autotrophicum]ACN14685.1 ABC-type phosphate/phosphonate transport system, putative periplasmic component [Desulforapulum autotrophicum HRM2]